jgi:hypothetical protein
VERPRYQGRDIDTGTPARATSAQIGIGHWNAANFVPVHVAHYHGPVLNPADAVARRFARHPYRMVHRRLAVGQVFAFIIGDYVADSPSSENVKRGMARLRSNSSAMLRALSLFRYFRLPIQINGTRLAREVTVDIRVLWPPPLA